MILEYHLSVSPGRSLYLGGASILILTYLLCCGCCDLFCYFVVLFVCLFEFFVWLEVKIKKKNKQSQILYSTYIVNTIRHNILLQS